VEVVKAVTEKVRALGPNQSFIKAKAEVA
jgi:hypothetical protein